MPASPDWRLVNFSSFLLLIWILPPGDGTTFAPLWNHVIVGFGIPVALHANIAASWGYLFIFDGVTLNVGWSIKNKRIKYEKASYIFSRDSKEVTWSSVTWERSWRSTKTSWALNVFLCLRASSPYGGVARCHARAALERRHECFTACSRVLSQLRQWSKCKQIANDNCLILVSNLSYSLSAMYDSGALNDLNTLKTLFRLSRVLLDL